MTTAKKTRKTKVASTAVSNAKGPQYTPEMDEAGNIAMAAWQKFQTADKQANDKLATAAASLHKLKELCKEAKIKFVDAAKHYGFQRAHAYRLARIGSGEETVEEHRAKRAAQARKERQQRSQAKAKVSKKAGNKRILDEAPYDFDAIAEDVVGVVLKALEGGTHKQAVAEASKLLSKVFA